VLTGPGLKRKRRGKGFSYYGDGGKALSDDATLTRIKELVIPPAWKKVWISPHANGHRTLELDDPEVVRAVRSLLRRRDRSERLMVCRNGSDWVDVLAGDLNGRFKELVGQDYSVKDLSTWHGTVLAAVAFVDADPPVEQKVIKRVEAAVMKEVSEALGNTPAVVRGSYVDPRVVEAYEGGATIAAAVKRAERVKAVDKAQAILEKATRTLIRRVGRG
jgi:DNA topoisomerase IB